MRKEGEWSPDKVKEIREMIRASLLKDIKALGSSRPVEFHLPVVGASEERDLGLLLTIFSETLKYLTRGARPKVSV